MTATTTSPASIPTDRRHALWGRLGFMLAGAVIGITAMLVITDGDDAPAATARNAAEARDPGAAGSSGASISADAAERWSLGPAVSELHPSADAAERWSLGPDVAVPHPSADAAERWATSAHADQLAACTSGVTSADAAERCLGTG